MAHTPNEPVMARPVVTGSVLAELTAQYASRTEEEKVELFKQLVAQEAARGSNHFKIPKHMPFLTRDRAMRLGFQWDQSYENMGPSRLSSSSGSMLPDRSLSRSSALRLPWNARTSGVSTP